MPCRNSAGGAPAIMLPLSSAGLCRPQVVASFCSTPLSLSPLNLLFPQGQIPEAEDRQARGAKTRWWSCPATEGSSEAHTKHGLSTPLLISLPFREAQLRLTSELFVVLPFIIKLV